MNLADKLTGRSGYGQYYGRLKILLTRPATQISGLVTLTLFTVVFFLIFAIIPTFKTIASLKREIEDAKNVEGKLQQKIHSLNQAETLYAQVAPELDPLDKILPPQPELERLAWQLHFLAAKNQLILSSGSFTEFEPDFIPISLTVKGNYLTIKAFVNDLNRLDRLLEIEELVISSKSVRADDKTLTANLKLKAFYQPL